MLYIPLKEMSCSSNVPSKCRSSILWTQSLSL
jgi:hypothetical protein